MKFVGAEYLGNNRCAFTVWAPQKKSMTLHFVYPKERKIEMKKNEQGYFNVLLDEVSPGDRYFFAPDGDKIEHYPDPGSYYQPEGVTGPSQIIDHTAYHWQDQQWRGIPFNELIFYELHVGLFTPEGTFEAIIPHLDELVAIGINALQLMPVNQFPGSRNWGYDGVYPYAVQHSYGGPEGLKKLVDACHQKGIAVFLDVVYNHLGPEGNYFDKFGPYTTNAYCTPWGDAINFDKEYSDGVRDFFSNNPVFWFELYHIDGLRFDAIHLMYDHNAVTIWNEMHTKVHMCEQQMGRPLYLVAESDFNSPKVMQVPEVGGLGFHAQWLDDFHHAMYVLLDKKGLHRYEDFGQMEQLAKAFKEGFVHTGEYVKARKRKYGTSAAGLSGDKFIVFTMNHDQAGNRVKGERLSKLVDFERLKVAAAGMLLSPYLPMLFMGEEYAEDVPFFYFIDYSEKGLIKMVQKSRKEQLAGYGDVGNPPDPQAEATFKACILQWDKRRKGKHASMLEWYKTLIAVRKQYEVLQNYAKNDLTVTVLGQSGIALLRQSKDGQQKLVCLLNLKDATIEYTFPSLSGSWEKVLDSKDAQWLEKKQKVKQAPATAKAEETIQIPSLGVLLYEQKMDE
ncbi:malto-oligosyltrehalose trehalohydrolase [Cytophagaceae bacterium YF14B1]|uniref:Malto-oligosyltrehalose trehalohydrolase n=1 Tax=Xanthocytophaga flava TaxID=3048013 RepID=A0AAE3QSW5_9BACT|nr:malto-oligosyltrehalose trehalohydrolase [Xanthocytophaga flavus]MDJ1484755.1 malto-oligosyltrehalose trehalohydrolase [Xanthocytophaga flavus]